MDGIGNQTLLVVIYAIFSFWH